MFDYVLFFVLVIGYIICAYYLTRFIRSEIILKNPYQKLFVLSFTYAMIFGLGVVATGGDPGIALPLPIILAGILDIWFWVPTRVFINGVIIPFVSWWTLIFIVMMIRDKIDRKFKSEV